MANRHLFLVTGALDSHNSVFTLSERASQTIETIKSIKRNSPHMPIIYVDAGVSRKKSLRVNLKLLYLRILVKKFVDISADPDVLEVQRKFGEVSDFSNYSVGRLGLYKSQLEVISYTHGIRYITKSRFSRADSLTKLSARYSLNSNFNVGKHIKVLASNDFLTSYPLETYLKNEFEYPLYCQSVLWSGNIEKISEIIILLKQKLQTAALNGDVLDLEHALYSSMRGYQVHEIDKLGVQGNASMTSQEIDF